MTPKDFDPADFLPAEIVEELQDAAKRSPRDANSEAIIAANGVAERAPILDHIAAQLNPRGRERLEVPAADTPQNFGLTTLDGVEHLVYLDTKYEGRLAYQAVFDQLVRITWRDDDNYRLAFGWNFFQFIPEAPTAETEFLRDLILGPNFDTAFDGTDPEWRAYSILFRVWQHVMQHGAFNDIQRLQRFNPQATARGMHLWSVERLRLMWEREQAWLMGSCASKAHLFGALLACCGMEPWRHGICSARYLPQLPSDLPSHVFNAVYYGGRWRYFDILGMLSGWMPNLPWATESVVMKDEIGPLWDHPYHVDYRHPFSMEQVLHRPIWHTPQIQATGVPYLGVRPGYAGRVLPG